MIRFCSGSYVSKLTPSTTVTSGSLAGADTITFLAPASRCFAASARARKRPLDSITTSTPSSSPRQCGGIAHGRRLDPVPVDDERALAQLDGAAEGAVDGVVP
jgi:hypothetical protein